MVALILMLTAACVSSLVYSLAGRGARAQVALDNRLRRAGGQEGAAPVAVELAPALRGSRMARSASLSRTLEGIRSARRLGEMLERAGWRLSVVEFLALTVAAAVMAGLIVSTRAPAFLVPGGAVGALVPFFLLRRGVKKRRDKFVKQLVDALVMISNALKAGVGLMQALDQAADQLKPPISDEFKRLLRDVRLGATPDDAFMALNERIGSQDLDIVLTAIIVQRSTGGNLAEILENVSATMRDRIKLKGEVKTLTSQQQLSGYLVGCMPVALLLLFNLMNHHYVAPLFSTTLGNIMLAFGGGLQLTGFLVIRKIVNIEV